MEPTEPGLYVVEGAGCSAVVRVGPAIEWDNIAGETLWEVEPEGPLLTDAEYALRGAAINGSMDLPAGWRWAGRYRPADSRRRTLSGARVQLRGAA
jgi:hypothetical protein